MSDQPKLRTKEDALKDPMPGDVVARKNGVECTLVRHYFQGGTGAPSVLYYESDEDLERAMLLTSWKALARGGRVLHVAQEGGEE